MTQIKNKQLHLDITAVIAGIMLTLASAPFNVYILAVASAALLLLCWMHSTRKRALLRGALYGIGLFASGASWVFISIHRYGNTNVPLALLITTLFIFILSAFTALHGYTYVRLFPRQSKSTLLLAFPALWVLFELLRSWLFTGFPWLLLGTTQLYSPLRSIAPLFSVYGISFFVALSAALCVVFILENYRWRLFTMGIFLFIWFACFAMTPVLWTQKTGEKLQVSLIQGNIAQEIKWDPKEIPNTLKKYWQLTQAHWQSNLVVWPEAAVPLLKRDAQPFLAKVSQSAKQHNTALILGLPIAVDHISMHNGNVQDQQQYFNAAIALGNAQGTYYKRHLVPFGEYVPFEKIFRGLIGFFDIPMSEFSEGPWQQALIHANGYKVAMLICYEVAYPSEVRSLLPAANLLIAISDDSWFGRSIASAQQLEMAQMRALETGRYLLSATNNGITAIVDPLGEITQALPKYQAGVLTGSYYAMQGSTPWVVIGITPLIVACFLLVILAYAIQRCVKKRDE